MPDQKIIDYIQSQLSAGVDSGKIKADLMMNGSLPSEIDAAFNSLNSVVTPQAPNMPVQNTVEPVAPTPVNPNQPVYSAPVVANVAVGSVLGKVMIAVIAVVVIGGISAGAYFGYQKINSGSSLNVGSSIVNTLEAFSQNELRSGEFSVSTEINFKNVGENYADLATDPMTKQVASQFEDVTTKLVYSGVVNKNTDNKVESSGDLKISVTNPTGGSLGMFGPQELGLQYRVFADNIYLNIQNIPSVSSMIIPPSIDTNKYLNQWFAIPVAITNQYSSTYTNTVSTSTLTMEVKSQIVDLFDKSGAFTIIDKKPEQALKGTAVTALYLKVDWDKLGDQLIKLSQANDKKEGITHKNSTDLEIKANVEQVKELIGDQAVIKVLIGGDGYVYGYSFSGKVVDKSANQIGGYIINFMADNYNKAFTIDRPANARSFEEVMTEVGALMMSPSDSETVLPSDLLP